MAPAYVPALEPAGGGRVLVVGRTGPAGRLAAALDAAGLIPLPVAGRASLVAALVFEPGAAVVDLDAPGAGEALAGRLLGLPTADRPRVLCLTRAADPATRGRLLDLGADAVLAGPADPARVVAWARQVCPPVWA